VQSKRTRPPRRNAEECFGIALREFRKASGVTQEDLAFQSGYHPTYIGQLERGKKSPSLRTIMKLSEVLGTNGSSIIRRVEELLSEA
jgi:transcriptional regulator with XRE-family HTH domain